MWRRLSHLPYLVVLLVTVLIFTRYLWGNNAWIETHDGIFHLIRLREYASMLRQGAFPPRWAGDLDHGFGLPLFTFVYPLPYLLGSPLVLLGLSAKWVIKLLFVGLYLFGTLGVYLSFAKNNKVIALLSALFFASTPYLLVNIFVRGALGEFMAICLIPWVYLTYKDIVSRGFRWYHPLAYALLFLSHNFLSFLFLPLYFLLALSRPRAWRPVCKSLIFSFCLSAFFLIPMFLERSYIYSVSANNFTYDFREHFVYVRQLLSSPWGHGYSVEGVGDGLSFALPVGTIFILIAGLFYARWQLAVLLAIIFMLLPSSQGIWELLPQLEIIQFPWRLLALTTVFLPYQFYKVLTALPRRTWGAGLILVIANLIPSISYTHPPYLMNNAQLANELYIHSDQTTTSSRLELLPRNAPQVERWRGDESVRVVGAGELKILKDTSLGLTFTFSSAASEPKLLLRRNYFPSWQVRDEEGRKLTTSPSAEGEILISPFEGTHTYTAWAGSTPVELLSNLLSLLTLIILASIGAASFLKKYLATRYRGYDLSIALRYLPISKRLKTRLKPKDTIIELGSEITGITPYLHWKVTGLDRGFDYSRKNKWLRPVAGSVLDIPFDNKSFDYAISVDMLEHIPAKLRVKAISEMLRVTRKAVYLTFPTGTPSEVVDRQLDDYFYRQNGYRFDYLVEHTTYGLPPDDFVTKLLKKQKEWQLIETVPNTSLWLWKLMLKLALSNSPWKTGLYHRLLLLTPLLEHFNWGHCYRRLYIIERV